MIQPKQPVQNTDSNDGMQANAPAVETDDILTLLDQMGLDFIMHTHHPLTHLEYQETSTAEPWINTRHECPEAPVAQLEGEGARN